MDVPSRRRRRDRADAGAEGRRSFRRAPPSRCSGLTAAPPQPRPSAPAKPAAAATPAAPAPAAAGRAAARSGVRRPRPGSFAAAMPGGRRRSRLRASARESVGAQVRARTRRRPGARARHRAQGPHHEDDVKAYVKSLLTGAAGAADPGRGRGPPAEVPGPTSRSSAPSRSSRWRASRRSPARACRRAGSTCRTSRSSTRRTSPGWRPSARDSRTRPRSRREADAAGVHRPRLRRGAAGIPALQRVARRGRREPGAEEVHAHRLRGRYAERPAGAGDPRRRPKDVYELARALAELSEKARAGKLSGAEMQGGCFTVSSLGGIGGTAFTPIINAPEVAILGVSRALDASRSGRTAPSCRA